MIHQKANFYVYIFSILIIISYFLGFYLNEDSAGGGKPDLLNHEWGNVQLFINNNVLDVLNDPRYESSRTPLYLIINKYNIFASTIEGLRISYFIFSLSIPITFFLLLKKINKTEDIKILLIISVTTLLSPYFRSSAFWANQENLAIFFVIISLIFLINGNEERKIKSSNNLLLPSFSSLFSFLGFYSDQKMVFLVIFVYFSFVIKNNLKFFIKFSLINFLFFIPTLYLFYIWGSIVPIESQFRLSLNLMGLNIFISNIGIYLIPILIVLIIKKDIKKYISFNYINILILILFSILLFYFLPNHPQFEGNGIIFKLLSVISNNFNIDWNLIKFLYFIINIIILFFLLNIFEKNLENLIYLFSFLVIFSITSFTYQSYVDPLFFILLFGYFKLKNKINLFNAEYAYAFSIFYLLILTSSILFRKFIIIS